MQITNLRNYSINLGFVEPFGVCINANGTLTLDDKYASYSSFILLKNNKDIRIDGFDSSSNEVGVTVSPGEFNTFAQGLFQIPDTWTCTGTITKGTPYILRSTTVGPFDFNNFYVLKLTFDSLYTIEVTFEKKIYTLTGIVDYLNTKISAYGVASIYNSYYLQIASKSVGLNSNIAIEVCSADCSSLLELKTIIPGTGTVAVVAFDTLNPTGIGIKGTTHEVVLLNDSNPSSELNIQRVTKGTPIVVDNKFKYITTGLDGKIEFEIGTSVDKTEHSNYMDVIIPTTYFLAKKPSHKLLVR